MLIQTMLAFLILSLLVWGLEMAPLPPVPKRLFMAFVVIIVAYNLAYRAGLLR